MLVATAVDLEKSGSLSDIVIIGQQVTSYRGSRITVDLWAMPV